MNNIANINRIRWTDTNDGRWYGFSVAIKLKEKESSDAGISSPVDHTNWCGLTDKGRDIINTLIAIKGIRYIEASVFGIRVKIEPIFSFKDYHDDIIELLNRTLFNGEADVAKLGARKSGEGLIRWAGTRKETVRWYGVSKALRLDEKKSDSAVINCPVEPSNWCGLTPEAREVVNTIYAMKGVFTIWVGAFDLSVEIAPVFSWDDYHGEVVALLTDKILGGSAFVEEKRAS